MSRDFWSRRREGVAAEEAAVETKADIAEQAEKTDAELLAEFDLPDPDTLKSGDDFSAFMLKTVPDHLRRRALRVLWRSNPVLANVDNLVDYGQDFTDKAMAVENIQTAYQVGKGMLSHVQEMARQAEALVADNEMGNGALESMEEPDVAFAIVPEISEERADKTIPDEAPDELADAPNFEPEATFAPAPRRMKFSVGASA